VRLATVADRRFAPHETTMATLVASLPALLLLLSWSPLTSEDMAMNMNRYQAVRMTSGGPAVCALDNPTATHVGLMISLCSTKCSKNNNCLYYNYRIPLNQQPVCQLYDFHPQSLTSRDDCVLFAVSHTATVSRDVDQQEKLRGPNRGPIKYPQVSFPSLLCPEKYVWDAATAVIKFGVL